MTPKLKKEKTKMTPTTPIVDKKTVKRSLFNLDTLKKESKSTEIEIPKKVKTFAEALDAVGGDKEKLVEHYNAFALRNAILEAKRGMSGEGLISPKIWSALTSGFLAKFPLADDSKAAKAAQRESVNAFIKSDAAMHSALKTIALAQTPVDEDEDDEETEETESGS